MEKKIKNIGKVCTSQLCEYKDKFPYCSEECITAQLVIEYEEENDNSNNNLA